MTNIKRREPIILAEGLASHPAFDAWTRLTGKSTPPTRIDSFQTEKILKKNKKPLVFRLYGVAGQRPVIAKRCVQHKIAVEQQIYTEVLPKLPIAAVRCLGAVPASDPVDHVWTFLDDAGDNHWVYTNRDHRMLAARWLAVMHAGGTHLSEVSRLPDRGADHYHAHLVGAVTNLSQMLGRVDVPDDVREMVIEIIGLLEGVGRNWHRLVSLAEAAPTLVHGDFVQKNVRVIGEGDTAELLAIDWEYAGRGTPAADISEAALNLDADAAAEYRRIVSDLGWQLSEQNLARLAEAGTIFRLISGIFWESQSAGFDYRPRFGRRMDDFVPHLRRHSASLVNGSAESSQT